ncbi:hypothetical protein V1512DRAFT_267227 [Lipomyces arxii]|uniref:uncharacterized protein n=1 Tax=Lipomyces arxii TaxID=56418 RepID=UPI0034CD865A
MSSLRATFNRAFGGGNLELFRFASYLMFPIGFMVYFGMGLEEDLERQYALYAQQAEQRLARQPKTEEDWARFAKSARGQQILRMEQQLLLDEQTPKE